MLPRNEAATQVAWHIINHDAAHGYSQPHRAGDGTIETIKLSDGEQVRIHGGDYDCSELVRMCYAAVNVLPWNYNASYMWTGNEEQMLKSHGFVEVAKSSERVQGDVLWRDGHTELYLGNNLQGGARIAETGGIDGKKGDQTGREITYSKYNPNNWTKIFRYKGSGTVAKIGWIKQNGKWWYKHPDGSYTKSGWEKINGKWYYFDAKGWMVTGWVTYKGNEYYCTENGDMVTGWKLIKTKWYCFDNNGSMYKSTCIKYKGKWCAVGKDGAMLYKVECDKDGYMKL